VNATHLYAVAPGRCRYLGSRTQPAGDDAPSSGKLLLPDEELLAVSDQERETARQLALMRAEALITPEMVAWNGGSYLRSLREAAKLSLSGLHEASQVALQPIWRLEHGEVKNPQYNTMALLAYTLNVPVCDLLNPPPPPWNDLGPRSVRPVGKELRARLEDWQGGPVISMRREAASLSQADLALVTGLTTKQISQIETGKSTNPKYETLSRLALALRATICDLVSNSPEAG
jgi:transcriptional regulator with XRE-family HTH domain